MKRREFLANILFAGTLTLNAALLVYSDPMTADPDPHSYPKSSKHKETEKKAKQKSESPARERAIKPSRSIPNTKPESRIKPTKEQRERSPIQMGYAIPPHL